MPLGRRRGWRRGVTTIPPSGWRARSRRTGAVLDLRRDGDFVVATVTSKSALLPGVSIDAGAVAAAEPPAG